LEGLKLIHHIRQLTSEIESRHAVRSLVNFHESQNSEEGEGAGQDIVPEVSLPLVSLLFNITMTCHGVVHGFGHLLSRSVEEQVSKAWLTGLPAGHDVKVQKIGS